MRRETKAACALMVVASGIVIAGLLPGSLAASPPSEHRVQGARGRHLGSATPEQTRGFGPKTRTASQVYMWAVASDAEPLPPLAQMEPLLIEISRPTWVAIEFGHLKEAPISSLYLYASDRHQKVALRPPPSQRTDRGATTTLELELHASSDSGMALSDLLVCKGKGVEPIASLAYLATPLEDEGALAGIWVEGKYASDAANPPCLLRGRVYSMDNPNSAPRQGAATPRRDPR